MCHPFDWVVFQVTDLTLPYPYSIFSRLRGFSSVYFSSMEEAQAEADRLNDQEKWDKHYPEGESRHAYSEAFLQGLLEYNNDLLCNTKNIIKKF